MAGPARGAVVIAAGADYTAAFSGLYIESFPSPDDFYDSPMNTINMLLSRLRVKQLQLVIALDEHKSLHKAAAVLSVTQSAASKALHELEVMLDAALFERSASGMIPNQYGRRVIEYARLLTTDLTQLCDDITNIKSGRSGRLAIGAIMGAIPAHVVPALDALHAELPAITVEIVEDTSARMLSQLDDGRLDLVIGRSAVSAHPARYRYLKLADEPLSVVAGYSHSTKSQGNISMRELAHCRWVTYPSKMPLRELLERELDLAGINTPVDTVSTASTFVTVALLNQGRDLVSLLPTGIAELFARHRMLRILPVVLRSPSQPFGIVTRRSSVLSPMAERFIELLQEGAGQ
ncbi:MAG: LysR substrate-binding domain-containing protein [Pseudomonas sp.]|uniref:LysR substrate-binding domain-containing protein n=1 Tax=Pseudomonas sp. TaxID=306 RepID=UPI003D6E6D24